MTSNEDGMFSRRQFGKKLAGLAGAAVVGASGMAALGQPENAFAAGVPDDSYNMITLAGGTVTAGYIGGDMLPSRLSANAAGLAMSITAEMIPDVVAPYKWWVIIEPYTNKCEIRQITYINGPTVYFDRALRNPAASPAIPTPALTPGTSTPGPTYTATSTPTGILTPTNTATSTRTPTPTRTLTHTPTAIPTVTSTPTDTGTTTPAPTATATPMGIPPTAHAKGTTILFTYQPHYHVNLYGAEPALVLTGLSTDTATPRIIVDAIIPDWNVTAYAERDILVLGAGFQQAALKTKYVSYATGTHPQLTVENDVSQTIPSGAVAIIYKDSTAAFQAAFDDLVNYSANVGHGGTVWCGPGVYAVNLEIRHPNICLSGQTTSSTDHQVNYLIPFLPEKPCIKIGDDSHSQGITLDHIALRGNGVGRTGLYIAPQCLQVVVNNVSIFGFTEHCLQIGREDQTAVISFIYLNDLALQPFANPDLVATIGIYEGLPGPGIDPLDPNDDLDYSKVYTTSIFFNGLRLTQVSAGKAIKVVRAQNTFITNAYISCKSTSSTSYGIQLVRGSYDNYGAIQRSPRLYLSNVNIDNLGPGVTIELPLGVNLITEALTGTWNCAGTIQPWSGPAYPFPGLASLSDYSMLRRPCVISTLSFSDDSSLPSLSANSTFFQYAPTIQASGLDLKLTVYSTGKLLLEAPTQIRLGAPTGIRAVLDTGVAAGLYVPWISGDSVATLYAGSTSSDQIGIRGVSDSNYGVYGTSSSSYGLVGKSVSQIGLQAIREDTSNTAVQRVAHFIHRLSSGTPSSGLGASIALLAETGDGDRDTLEIQSSFSDISTTDGSRDSTANLYVYDKDSFGTIHKRLALSMQTDGDNATASSRLRMGFFGVAAQPRPAALTQTYNTADRTLSAYTANNQGTAYTGQDNTQAGTVYAKFADLNGLRVAYENLRAFTEDLAQFVNAHIDDEQALGFAQ